MATMHNDDDNEYDELLPMVLATKCQSGADQFGESNDCHDESNDDGVVHGTIHALFSASISAMSRCIGGLNAAIRDPLNAATRDPWWLVELKAPEAQHEQLSACGDSDTRRHLFGKAAFSDLDDRWDLPQSRSR